ncbi:hypothetical protein QBC38DRAFT_443794 [Podospora fimiseda]|uniref:Uncharacterized protein n=1 Tax=Podospora fimiseda TaxID=252190 RepID=A0AAN7BPZ6_9PEZI|nr:hypothetical protein QBC38DRAFT_443794 [Podospora fimiseda]
MAEAAWDAGIGVFTSKVTYRANPENHGACMPPTRIGQPPHIIVEDQDPATESGSHDLFGSWIRSYRLCLLSTWNDKKGFKGLGVTKWSQLQVAHLTAARVTRGGDNNVVDPTKSGEIISSRYQASSTEYSVGNAATRVAESFPELQRAQQKKKSQNGQNDNATCPLDKTIEISSSVHLNAVGELFLSQNYSSTCHFSFPTWMDFEF